MPSWYPGLGDYMHWMQEQNRLDMFRKWRDYPTIAIRETIDEQTERLSADAKQIVATSEQIKSAVTEGFQRLTAINNSGFDRTATALEELQCTVEYNMDLMVHQAELQTKFLRKLVSIAEKPFETKVREFYKQGCEFIQQGIYTDAKECFEYSLQIEKGKYFFPSYYELGRLYLSDTFQEADPQKASIYLLKAHNYIEGKFKLDNSFMPILADCKLLLSTSYYRQLRGGAVLNSDVLDMAITYAMGAISLNTRLSIGYYYLAKYSACLNNTTDLLKNLKKAIELDRNYSLQTYRDDVFSNFRPAIIGMIDKMRKDLSPRIKEQLESAKYFLEILDKEKTSESKALGKKYHNLRREVLDAQDSFETETYFGVSLAKQRLDSIGVAKADVDAHKKKVLKDLSDSVRLSTYSYSNSVNEINELVVKVMIVSSIGIPIAILYSFKLAIFLIIATVAYGFIRYKYK